MFDVVIVGAGLHGLSAALHFARAGLKPVVLEKDYPGRHASGVNAGGVRRLGRHIAEIPISIESMRLWHEIEELVDDGCGFKPCGQIRVAETEAEVTAQKGRVDELNQLGFDHEQLVSAREVREIVPAISPHCRGAIWCREDGAANPFRTVQAFSRKLRTLGGVVEHGTGVTSVRRRAGQWCVDTARARYEAPILVNAAGAWGGEIARLVGDDAPLRAEAPMLMITERVALLLKPVLGAQGRTLSFKQYDNGTLLIGGGYRGRASPKDNRAQVDILGCTKSARTVSALFPQLSNVKVVRCWAGLEGVLPDAIPVIGPSASADNAYHVFGFSAHGFQLAPMVGKLIADLAIDGACVPSIEAFRIDRFTRRAPEALTTT